jgi:nucleoside-diphosphate-sugar epimerase
MRIFVAGATGALGQPVVRRLVAAGHTVTGLTRSRDRARTMETAGARAAVGDALDAEALRALVAAARPDQVVHLLTALPPAGPLRAAHLRATNRVRTEGTANLLRAAIDAGARRLVGESFVGIYGRTNSAAMLTEDATLSAGSAGAFAEAIAAMREMEDALLRARAEIETVALRIGYFYGPTVPSTIATIEQARRGWLFAPTGADGVGPFIHIEDAAAAVVAAVQHQAPSPVYNVVDDEPFPLMEFLTLLTKTIGARPPRPLPMWMAKIGAPLIAELATAKLRLSNAKAKRELGWRPEFPTVREGILTLRDGARRAA